MKRWRLNSIAARISVTIVLAIILGIALELAVSVSISYVETRYGPRQEETGTRLIISRFGIWSLDPRRNFLLVSARIAGIARIVEQTPRSSGHRSLRP